MATPFINPLAYATEPEDKLAYFETVRAASDYTSTEGAIGFLEQAIANDTAPTIEAEQVRTPNIFEAIGAALSNVARPGAAAEFAQQAAQTRAYNARLAAEANRQNQVQQGYLQRRNQERQETIAKLEADLKRIRSEAETKRAELGVERDVRVAAQQEKALAAQRREDAMAMHKWYEVHGMNWEQMFSRARFGQDDSGNEIPLEQRLVLFDALQSLTRTLPNTERGKENQLEYEKRLGALHELLVKPVVDPDDEPDDGVDGGEGAFSKRFRWLKEEYRGNKEDAGDFGPLVMPEVEALVKTTGSLVAEGADEVGEGIESVGAGLDDYRSAAGRGLVEPNAFLSPTQWAEKRGFYDPKRPLGSFMEALAILEGREPPSIESKEYISQLTDEQREEFRRRKAEREKRMEKAKKVFREGLLRDMGVKETN